jgi:putative cardiolipin synthase
MTRITAVRRLLTGLALATLVLTGCAQLEPRPELPPQTASAPGSTSELDALIAGPEASHPGQSGFRLVPDGLQAFAIRARTALLAGRSLDVQTYIWHDDQTGMFLAHRILEAADRGVRVRLLVDDMDARAKNVGFAVLHSHPNIQVRMFNPFASREGTFSLITEGLGSFNRVNRRMHNKSWIADNRLAVVGGRNLGDEYFGASEEVNFVDLDYAMVGPVVRDVSASFDRFWNSPVSYPMDILDPEAVRAEDLDALRKTLADAAARARAGRYADEQMENEAVRKLVSGEWPMEWVEDYFFVSDFPDKAIAEEPSPEASNVLKAITPAMQGTREELTIISPYFVPGDEGTRFLVDIAQGRNVRILTNSLVANDVAAVHGGYSRWRDDLLEGGVRLFEMKPVGNRDVPYSLRGSGGASLHTKALSVDGERLFVGSYNLDPRSTSLNCEQGVMVASATLAQQFEGFFDRQTSGTYSWAVSLDEDDDLSWTDGEETFDKDPEASAGRRFQAWLAKVLHIDSQL